MATIFKKPVPDTDALWAIDIQIRSEPLGDANAMIIFKAYNSETGAIDHEHIENMKVDSLMALIQSEPEGNMAKAYYFLVLAMKDEYERQNPVVVEEPV